MPPAPRLRRNGGIEAFDDPAPWRDCACEDCSVTFKRKQSKAFAPTSDSIYCCNACEERQRKCNVKVARPQVDAETGEIVLDKKGRPVADKELSGDTENIPLKEDVDAYMAREVLPYAPGAWIEEVKDPRTKKKIRGVVGYEIPFTRYFYEYKPLRPSAEILDEIRELEASIAGKLKGVLL